MPMTTVRRLPVEVVDLLGRRVVAMHVSRVRGVLVLCLMAGPVFAAPEPRQVFQVTVTGKAVTAAAVREVLETRRKEILACDGSQRPTVIRMELEVRPDGALQSRGPRSAIARLGPQPCMEAVVKKLKVKRPSSGGTIPVSVVVDFGAAYDRLTGAGDEDQDAALGGLHK